MMMHALFIPAPWGYAQILVMLNTCNCLLPVKLLLLSTSTAYLWFPFSTNQNKNIKTLIIWSYTLSQVTTCPQIKITQNEIRHSLTVTDRQYDPVKQITNRTCIINKTIDMWSLFSLFTQVEFANLDFRSSICYRTEFVYFQPLDIVRWIHRRIHVGYLPWR